MRTGIHKLVTKHRVPINPEYFFLTSIVHSLDHFIMGAALTFKNLDTEILPAQPYPHIENYMWYVPSENVFTNLLRVKKYKNAFYQELYEMAVHVDKEYANHITLSISF